MREDDDEFRHYLPLLRRIIILVAVITAVPVILWTITAFVRTYVGPPKVPDLPPAGVDGVDQRAGQQCERGRQRSAANGQPASQAGRSFIGHGRRTGNGDGGSRLALRPRGRFLATVHRRVTRTRRQRAR